MRVSRVLHDDSVTVTTVTVGPPDDDGVPVETTGSYVWEGVNVQQLSAAELTDSGRNATVTTFRVSGPIPAGPLNAGGRILWNGETYSIDGHPDVRTGRLRINHASLVMVKVKG